MRFNFRKIASVLASAGMIGSTVGLAAAANFPDPFVKGGNADVAIVWGSTAANTDLVASIDITNKLQEALTAQTVSGGTSSGTTVSGDSVNLRKSSDNLNLGNTLSGVFGTTVDDDDLTVLLADGTYSNSENTEYNFEQKITIAALKLQFFADSRYNDKEPTIGIKANANDFILNYTIDFTTDPESDVTSGDVDDYETTDVPMLGSTFYILDAKNGTNGNTFGKFTLLDSANKATVQEGETVTTTTDDGKSYEVSINFVSSTEARLSINGELTDSLAEGGIQRLNDGSYVGIRDILSKDVAGTLGSVEFSIGSGKLEIDSGNNVELNDDTIDRLKGYVFRGTASSDKQKLDKIVIEWKADERLFLTPENDLVLPGFGAVKFTMGEFFTATQEITTVQDDGSDTVQISVPIKDGTANINLLYANTTGEFTGIGEAADQRLSTSANATLIFNRTAGNSVVDDKFVVTYNTSRDAESYLLEVPTITTKENKNKTTIRNVVTGEDVCVDKAEGDECKIGSASFTIPTIHRSGADEWLMLTAGTDTNFNTVFTKEGLKIYLPYEQGDTGAAVNTKGAISFKDDSNNTAGHDSNTFYVYFDEEDKDDNLASGTSFNISIDDKSDGNVEVSTVDTGQSNEKEIENDDNTVSYVQSDLASRVRRLGDSSAQRSAEITYHGTEAFADVFLADESAVVSGGGSGTGDGQSLGSITVRDSELSSVSGKNLIVVGGSCVNTVAANLLEVSSPTCGADFTASTSVGSGQFLIETFSRSGGKVATLVAGYGALDTTNAAKYLTTQTVDTAVGQKYIGTSATSAELQVESA